MSQSIKPILIKNLNKQLPLILNNKRILKKELLPFKGNLKVVKFVPFQQDVIYESKTGDFLPGDLLEMTIVNRFYKSNNSCRTVAKCKSLTGEAFEKTSDEITKLIGHNNYSNLFASLCSVINQELKIRGIYSLLTVPNVDKTAACQTDISKADVMHMQCQTDDSYITTYKQWKMKRRSKRTHLTPYVVRETSEIKDKKPKRLIIEPCNFNKILHGPDKKEHPTEEHSQKAEPILPDLGPFLDDDSNNSGRFSSLSVQTTSDLMTNPFNILDDIDKLTRRTPENLNGDTDYKLCDIVKSDGENANNKTDPVIDYNPKIPSEQERVKMLLQQGLSDWQNCLKQDESGHLPIHAAVLNNDLVLLKRQCVVLKMRGISVDLPADDLTPLRMSLFQDNVQLTTLLLQHNADALACNAQDRSCFHVAAEMPTDHLQALVNHYKHNARKILEEDEELWKPEYTIKSEAELVKVLFNYINKMADSQGYTAIMLASKLGIYENVRLLLENSPQTVNTKMPSSGNTALYLAVGAACMDAAERGNRSKVVDHFKKTIEILIDNGADPNMPNFAGASVNDLMMEYNIADISMLIANSLTYRNFQQGKLPEVGMFNEVFMIVKDEEGKVLKLEDTEKVQPPPPNMLKPATKSIAKKTIRAPKTNSKKPTILKTEILTGDSIKPIITKIGNIDTVKNKPQHFKLNTPLILKRVSSKTSKRKIEITVETDNKKTNTND